MAEVLKAMAMTPIRTYEDASEKFLPGVLQPARETMPRSANWKFWEQPLAVLPIDKKICELIAAAPGSKAPRLRDRDTLFRLGVLCPYYVAREYAIHAVDRAAVEGGRVTRREKTSKKIDPRIAAEKKIVKIATALENIRASVPNRSTGDMRSGMDHMDIRAAIEQDHTWDSLLKFSADLRAVAAASKTYRADQKPHSRALNSWLWTITIVLAEAWHLLTGKEPPKSRSGPFYEFVVAVCESLGDALPDDSEWFLNAVIHARNNKFPWQLPSAAAKDELQPGVSREIDVLIGERFLEGSEPNTMVGRPRPARPQMMLSIEVVRRHRAILKQAQYWHAVARDPNFAEDNRALAHSVLRTFWKKGGVWRGVLERLNFTP